MGFFDAVFSAFTSPAYADDNQAADELKSDSGKAYGEAHETPDDKPDVSQQKGTEESSKDVKGTPKETDEDDKPFQGETNEGGDEEEEPEEEEEEEEEEEPEDPLPRLKEGEFCCFLLEMEVIAEVLMGCVA